MKKPLGCWFCCLGNLKKYYIIKKLKISLHLVMVCGGHKNHLPPRKVHVLRRDKRMKMLRTYIIFSVFTLHTWCLTHLLQFLHSVYPSLVVVAPNSYFARLQLSNYMPDTFEILSHMDACGYPQAQLEQLTTCLSLNFQLYTGLITCIIEFKTINERT